MPIGPTVSKPAPQRPTSVQRASIGPFDLTWLEASRPSAALSTLAIGLGTTLLAGTVGFTAGRIAEAHDVTFAHASGACIAMELAAAHGAVDEHDRRMVLRSLASVINPYFGKFPERASEISSACDALTKGVVRRTVLPATSK